MPSFLRYYWEMLRTSYWFLPALMGVAAIVASAVTVGIDHALQTNRTWNVSWTYTGGPEGARAVLATIAGSMITVAGVVFSITIVALSLASGQFGSRLLRNFIRDRRNQFVLGTFTATFLYCLLILRTVRGHEHHEFVPGISVTIGILLAVTNLGVLIYYIHHVAISIQANAVIKAVVLELHETIDRLWPEDLGEDAPAEEAAPAFAEHEARPLLARSSGYIDAIDADSLIELAKEDGLVLRLMRRPGHFVIAGTPLAWAWPKDRADDDTEKHLNRAYILVAQRSPYQDIEFAIDQLVEVAVRALSPGINDPFTAMSCIDALGESLARFAKRSVPSRLRVDKDGKLRVITYPVDFRGITDSAFNQIRQYGSTSAAVLICLMQTIGVVASLARRSADQEALAHHAELVLRAGRRGLSEPADLAELEERYRTFEAIRLSAVAAPGR